MFKYLINKSTTSILKATTNLFGSKLRESNTSCTTRRNYTLVSQYSVGTLNSFRDAYFELCKMDYGSVEAFNVLINKLEDNATIKLMESFKNDHLRHIKEIQDIMKKKGDKYLIEPNAMKLLTKSRNFLGNISLCKGDKSLLNGMLSNGIDLESAYDIANKRNDQWPEAIDQLKRGYNDAKRQRLGIEKSIQSLKE